MKKSKIFLGVTTMLLGVTAVAATKSHRSALTQYYVTNGSQCNFVQQAPPDGCSLPSGATCTVGGHKIFTARVLGLCTHAIFHPIN